MKTLLLCRKTAIEEAHIITLDGIDIHLTSKWTGSDIVKEDYTYQTILSRQMSKKLGKKYRKRQVF